MSFLLRESDVAKTAAGKKRQFLQLLHDRPITVAQAANEVGRTDQTIRNWAEKDPEFAAAYEEAKEFQHSLRLNRVETALFQKILGALDPRREGGHCSASLIIFWLKANSPKYRMADKHYLHHSGELKTTGKQDVDLEARIELYTDMLQGGSGDGGASEAGETSGDGDGVDS